MCTFGLHLKFWPVCLIDSLYLDSTYLQGVHCFRVAFAIWSIMFCISSLAQQVGRQAVTGNTEAERKIIE